MTTLSTQSTTGTIAFFGPRAAVTFLAVILPAKRVNIASGDKIIDGDHWTCLMAYGVRPDDYVREHGTLVPVHVAHKIFPHLVGCPYSTKLPTQTELAP